MLGINFNTNDYTAFIEKKNNNIVFCKTGDSGLSGFHDDVTGLMDFIPQGFTSDNEMTWVIRPFDLLKWLKENPDRAEQAYKKLPWLKEIDEFSNPIIAIGKCK